MRRSEVLNMKRLLKRTTYSFVAILAIFLVIASTSCTPKEKPEPAPSALAGTAPLSSTEQEGSLVGFYPLKVGNLWVYEGDGMEYSTFVQTVAYKKGNRYQINIDNGGTVMANILEENRDNIINTYKSGEIYNNEELLDKGRNVNIILLQAPIEKGNFWISEENHYEIIDTAVDLKVPAGRFKDCIAVRMTFKDNTSNMIYYYKRGIGLVQSEFRTEAGDLVTSKLKRYEIK
jgi:hypothetical protein